MYMSGMIIMCKSISPLTCDHRVQGAHMQQAFCADLVILIGFLGRKRAYLDTARQHLPILHNDVSIDD